MHATTGLRAPGFALMGLLVGAATDTQAQVHAYITHAADVASDTPNGLGVLTVAFAEAEIAALHAGLAVEDLTNLDGMRRHAGHTLHALDPAIGGVGPGLGYGVKHGAAGAAFDIEFAAGSDGASQNVTFHARHIDATLGNVVQWTDEAIALAQRVQSSPTAADAAPLVSRLDDLCRAILRGRDTDRDRLVGWRTGEGGLAQATQHMNLLKRGEGLSR